MGEPVETVPDYADPVAADLVVMWVQDRRGPDRSLLGSTTARVVRLSDVSGLTVRNGS